MSYQCRYCGKRHISLDHTCSEKEKYEREHLWDKDKRTTKYKMRQK